ncbi:MAG: nuclear transport factor 2 family protein [Chloroflexota bacterium]
MVKVTVEASLGHSPSKGFLRDFLVAFAEGNSQFIVESVTDDIVWEIVGEGRIEGKEAFSKAVGNPNPNKTVELTIEHLITHGKEASASGHFVLDNDERYAFADVYIFKNTKADAIRSIQSFNIKLG